MIDCNYYSSERGREEAERRGPLSVSVFRFFGAILFLMEVFVLLLFI